METPNSSAENVTNSSTEKLMRDLRAVVSDTEDLLKATAGDVSEHAARARARTQESLRNLRERMIKAERDLMVRARAAGRATDQYVHENPWPAVGVAAGIGFVLGILVGRR